VYAERGVGKSALALEVAKEYEKERRFAAGVGWVDLREMRQVNNVVGRLSKALDLKLQNHDEQSLLSVALSRIGDRDALLVADTAEDPLQTGFFLPLLYKLLKMIPGLRIVLTTTDTSSIHDSDSAGIKTTKLTKKQLTEGVAKSLEMELLRSHGSSGELAEACGREPIAIHSTCRQVEAGNATRFELVNAIEFKLKEHPDERKAIPALEAIFSFLPDDEREHLARLSVFRGSFDLQAAGKILDMTQTKVRATLHALSGIISFDTVYQRYAVHGLVAAACRRVRDEHIVKAREAYLEHHLKLMRELSDLFNEYRGHATALQRYDEERHNLEAIVEEAILVGSKTAVRAAAGACTYSIKLLSARNNPDTKRSMLESILNALHSLKAQSEQHENTIRSVQKALVRALLDSGNVEGAERQLQSISRQCTEQDTVEDGDDLLPLQAHLYVYKGDYTNAEQLRRKLLQKSKKKIP
jgi:hypothetical protein